MSQLINAVVFAEDQDTADERVKELANVSKGINILCGYSDVSKLHKGLKDESDAVIIVDIKQGCKNIPEYFALLKLRKRPIICITPENGEFIDELKKMNIPSIQLPLSFIKMEVVLQEYADGSGKVDIILKAEKVFNTEKKKIQTINITLGKSHTFKTKKGKRHFYIDSILGFKINKDDHNFYLIPVKGDDIRIMEGCEEIKKKLMDDGFECSFNGELLNLLHVDDLIRKGRYLYARTTNKDFKIGETHEKDFDEAYTKYWDERGR
jgi:hypothetical protein